MSGINGQTVIETPLPKGTVTFLFTDIEGSTKLLERLREGYATLLEEQRGILRAAFARWNGHEMDTQGDAFFVAFPRALDAVNCVIEAQRELAAHEWPNNVTVRVRMGMHTGEPIIARTGYVGMDVHRAARLTSTGFGGQVLLSQTTYDLVFQDLPAGTRLRNLGAHKLKDIVYPQEIYQLDIPGLPSDFPPLKSLEKLDREDIPPAPGDPPYKGLQFFNESDAEWFFGRHAVAARLVEAVHSQRFLAVIGASGSGKSSVVRAGMIPPLRHDPTIDWKIHVITPTPHPLEALAVSLTKDLESVTATATLIDDLQAGSRSLYLFTHKLLSLQEKGTGSQARLLLLLIDQFEELFTLCRSETERQAFIDNLLTAVTIDGGLVTAAITLRADFYERVAQYPELRELVSSQQVYIGAMSASELRQSIEEPAKRGGWELSPGLVELMLHDIGAGEGRQPEPGALPLLSHALLETWKRRRGNLLNLRAYTEAGGVRGAIARTANSVYNQGLTPEQQEIARSIFLRLTELGEGTQDTRRRISISELIPPGPALETEQIRTVLLKLADARLITTGEDTVEVAHEALIREWPTLREWLSQGREGLRLHRHLTEAAQEWHILERDPGALYRGARLAQGLEWALNNPRQLNLQEQAFLNASQEAAEREAAEREAARLRELEAAQKLAEAEHQRADEQAQSARRLHQRAVFLAIALVVALGLAAAAIYFFSRADQNADLAAANAADARQQQAIAEQERANAELRAQEAYARELSQAAEANLERDPELSMLLALEAVSVLENADLPVSLQVQDILHRAMQASRARLTFTHPGGAWGIDINPDGTRLATAGNDGAIRLWDAQTGKLIQTLAGHQSSLEDVAFSPDGQHLASAGFADATRIWDHATGEFVQTLSSPGTGAYFLAYSPDGTRLAVSDKDDTVRIWDISSQPTTGLLLQELPGQMGNIAFSPDGSRLLTTSIDDGKSRVWDLMTGKELLILPYNYQASGLVFSPDGKRLAVEGSEIGMVTIFDLASGESLISLCCHTAGIRTIDFNSDGTLLATAGQEGVAKIWDANSGKELLSLSGGMGPVDDLVFSPECAVTPKAPFAGCGQYVYTTSRNGSIRKWDVSPAGNRDLLTAQGMNANFTPDGKGFEVYELTLPNQVALHTWQFQPTGEAQQVDTFTLPPMPVPISAGDDMIFPEKAIELLASPDGSVQTWEVGKPESLITYNVPISTSDSLAGVYILPDGLRMATRTGQGSTKIWDIATGEVLFSVTALGEVNFSPDGRLLAIGDENGSLSLWDAATGELLRTIPAHQQAIMSLAFSPDGERLATGSLDTTAKIWDVSTGHELYTLVNRSTPYSPAFSPDGKRLAVNQLDGSLYLWDVDPESSTAWQLLFKFTGLDEPAIFNGFSPDGKIIYVGGYFGQTVRLYILPLEDLVALARSRLTRNWTQEECQRFRIDPCPLSK